MSANVISLWERAAPDAADELARWHAGTGMTAALRYAIPERPGDFLTWIEAPDDAGAVERRLRELGTAPVAGYAAETVSLQLMCDVGERAADRTPWLYIVHTDIPDNIVDEYNEWYDHEHLPRLVTVPGVLRARRYTAVAGAPRYLTAYALTDKDAFESPEGLKARKTPWTARMRSLFRNTRRSMCRLLPP